MTTEPIYTPAQNYTMRFLLAGIEDQQRRDSAALRPIPVVSAMPGKRVLVVAPHLDDEVIGCGGLIGTYCAAGANVTILFCTSGSGGPSSESPAAREAARQERIVESRRATSYFGQVELCYGDFPERKLLSTLKESDLLTEMLRNEQFDAVFTPGPNEMHPDHKAVWSWVQSSFAQGRCTARLYTYEVWGSCNPTVLLHVRDDVWAKKMAAMKIYKSQLAHFEYRTLIKQLSSSQDRFAWIASGYERVEAFHQVQEVTQ